ncbi:MAG TPA: lipocalin-like domain-containing protein [Terriglobales bacterium]|jgi:Lipocalin-like domain|nr:lipocalin-like domain-containing protein [Terriglobales bacterium]
MGETSIFALRRIKGLQQLRSEAAQISWKQVLLAAFVFSLSVGLSFSQTNAAIRSRLIGTWKLISTEETMKDGSVRPYRGIGANAKGFLMYQGDGYMCADLVNPERAKWADPVKPTAEEKAAAAEGSFAYCGRFEIDVQKQQIIHLPEVATDPGFVGSRQVRPFKFDGERLILSDVEKNDPAVARWKIVWEKVH